MTSTKKGVPAIGPLAAALAGRLADGDVIYVAENEQRAAALAAALAAFMPAAVVVHVPASDALPGDDAPASPSVIGQRVAALSRLRVRGKGRAALITSVEATATRYAPPAAFDTEPPIIAVGDPLDLSGFAVETLKLGYVVDDRIDEPGEVAVRGEVVDIYPVDAADPVRIEVEDGRVVAVRCYDPVSQRTDVVLDRIEIGRAVEPVSDESVAILAHLPGAALGMDEGVAERRRRIVALARRGIIETEAWDIELADRERLTFAIDAEAVPPRFVEARDPAREFTRFANKTVKKGRLILMGSPRDLRFLTARSKLDFTPVESWSEALTRPVGSAMTMVAPIDRGFLHDDIAVVAGADLLGGRANAQEMDGTADLALFSLGSHLRLGDVVVHEDFGVGVVEGLERLEDGGGAVAGAGGDAIVLGYAREGKRLVPVDEADRIWRYGADEDAVSLDALDGTSWQKRRGAIDQAIAESARGLVALAAERDARTTPVIEADASAYERFVAGFPFTETADQARAIAAMQHDLASGRPMDRLVVGDVGYGKTEVALRAAAIVALSGRQVAIAAPTTVLVRQHVETFRVRFEGTGIAVAGLSRLTKPAERREIKAGLADGSVGVVIGTGAVAGKSVHYHDLALVVIDEEQRFGTAEKKRLRALGEGHVMTLSATPIPRTLQAALVGLQQVSIIATPPARRQPIRTTVTRFTDEAVRTALLREKGRSGQSFVVVPRIADIAPLEARLRSLVPDLSLVTAHGKMQPAAIDEAMVAFADGDGDVLLATNIIEAGLDVPRANTMIVHHADRFGLSQLHQLRGRVGRGGRRGRILLTTGEDAEIAESTLKRLRTLQAFDQLGAGFAISARDLDMRGAGDLLGEAQAGHMKLIGVDLYQHLLGMALRKARGESVDAWTPELNLGLAGRLAEDWIPEVDIRLSLYGRLARLVNQAALDAFEEELEDRFGQMPNEAATLLDLARTQITARGAGVWKIDAGPAAVALTPRRRQNWQPPDEAVAKDGRWIIAMKVDDATERAARIMTLLDAMLDAQ